MFAGLSWRVLCCFRCACFVVHVCACFRRSCRRALSGVLFAVRRFFSVVVARPMAVPPVRAPGRRIPPVAAVSFGAASPGRQRTLCAQSGAQARPHSLSAAVISTRPSSEGPPAPRTHTHVERLTRSDASSSRAANGPSIAFRLAGRTPPRIAFRGKESAAGSRGCYARWKRREGPERRRDEVNAQ